MKRRTSKETNLALRGLDFCLWLLFTILAVEVVYFIYKLSKFINL